MSFLSLDRIQLIDDPTNQTATAAPPTAPADDLQGPQEVSPYDDPNYDPNAILETIGIDMLVLIILGGIAFLIFISYVAYKKRYHSMVEEYASNPETQIKAQELTSKEEKNLEQWEFNLPGPDFLPDIDVRDEVDRLGKYFNVTFQQEEGNIRTMISNKAIEKNKDNCYFEFEIEKIDVGVDIVIGLGTKESYMKHTLPGARSGSIGFHSKGGVLFINGKEKNAYELDAKFGETIGLGYNFEMSRVYLFCNARYLNEPPKEFGSPSKQKSPEKSPSVPGPGGKQNEINLDVEKVTYYPMIGATGPCRIRLNIGGAPFSIHHKEIAKGLL